MKDLRLPAAVTIPAAIGLVGVLWLLRRRGDGKKRTHKAVLEETESASESNNQLKFDEQIEHRQIADVINPQQKIPEGSVVCDNNTCSFQLESLSLSQSSVSPVTLALGKPVVQGVVADSLCHNGLVKSSASADLIKHEQTNSLAVSSLTSSDLGMVTGDTQTHFGDGVMVVGVGTCVQGNGLPALVVGQNGLSCGMTECGQGDDLFAVNKILDGECGSLAFSDTAQDGQRSSMASSDTAQDGQRSSMASSDTAQDGQRSSMASSDTAQDGQRSSMASSDTAQDGQRSSMASSDTAQGGQRSSMASSDTAQGGQQSSLTSSDTAQDGQHSSLVSSDSTQNDHRDEGQFSGLSLDVTHDNQCNIVPSSDATLDDQSGSLTTCDVQEHDQSSSSIVSQIRQDVDLVASDTLQDDYYSSLISSNGQQDSQYDSLWSSYGQTEGNCDSLMSSVVEQDGQFDSMMSSYHTQDSEFGSQVSLDAAQHVGLRNANITEYGQGDILTTSQRAYIEQQIITAMGDGLEEACKQLSKPLGQSESSVEAVTASDFPRSESSDICTETEHVLKGGDSDLKRVLIIDNMHEDESDITSPTYDLQLHKMAGVKLQTQIKFDSVCLETETTVHGLVGSHNTESLELANTEPLEAANTEPLETANAELLESANTELLKSANAEPLESANAELLESANTELLESATTELLESANTELMESATAEPLESANSELLESATSESSESANAKLLESANTELLESANTELLESATTELLEPITDEPLEPITDEPLEPITDELLDSITDEPLESANTEPLESVNIEPVKPADSEQVVSTTLSSESASSECLVSTSVEYLEPTNLEPSHSSNTECLESVNTESFQLADTELLISTTTISLVPANSESLVPISLETANTEYLEPTNTECLEPANTECLKPTNTEIVEPANTECLEPADPKCFEPANTEIVVPSNTEIVEPANTECLEPTNTECLEPANTDIVEPANTECLEPADTKCLEPANTEIVVPPNTEIVEPANTECLEPADTKCLEPANTEIVVPPNTEIVEPANTECLEPADTKCFEPANSECLEPTNTESLESDNFECFEPANTECLEPADTKCLEPANTEIVVPPNTECLEPADTKCFEPANSECLEPTNTESLESDNFECFEPANTEYLEPANTECLKSASTDHDFENVVSVVAQAGAKSIQETMTPIMPFSNSSPPADSELHVHAPSEDLREDSPTRDMEQEGQHNKHLGMDNCLSAVSKNDAATDDTLAKTTQGQISSADTCISSPPFEKIRKSLSWLPKASSSSVDSFGPDEINAIWGIESAGLNLDEELTFLDNDPLDVPADSKSVMDTTTDLGAREIVPAAASSACEGSMVVAASSWSPGDTSCDNGVADPNVKDGALGKSISPVCDNNSEGSNDSGRGGSEHDMVCQGGEVLVHFNFCMPSDLCGQFIGKHGKNINYLKSKTGAHVSLTSQAFMPEYQICQIVGTQVEVDDALSMIRRKFPLQDYPHLTMDPVDMTVPLPLQPENQVVYPEVMQLSLPEGVSVDVFVSAVVDAGQVFVQQPTHRSYMSLEKMNYFLNLVYSQDPNVPSVPLPIESGVICVCESEGYWYRAMIMSPIDENGEVQLKFVDYGGYITLPVTSLKQIRVDFMHLPFQAVECFMANITPNQGEKLFSDEATQALCDLTQGKLLQCQVVARTEYGVPYIHLYQVNPERNSAVLINRALVNRRLVRWIEIL